MPDVYPLSAPEPRGMLGYDGTHYYVVRVDDQGNLRLAPGGVNLRQYAAVYHVTANAAGDAGDLTAIGATVPAGALVVVTNTAGYLLTGSATRIATLLFSAAATWVLNVRLAPVVKEVLRTESMLVLGPGDRVHWSAFGVGAGTEIYGYAVGYYVRT